MKIHTRLISGFAVIVLLMFALALYSANKGQESLRESIVEKSILLCEAVLKKVDSAIYLRIEELQLLSKSYLLQKAVSESNKEFMQLADIEGYIDQQDREWIAAPPGEITPLMQELIDNKLSFNFRRKYLEFYEKHYGYRIFGEIFATNKYGANVALTQRTSDYRQDDEEWWQTAREKGLYIGDIEYDESAGIYSVGTGIRIDNENGDFMGIIKGVIAPKDIAKEAEIARGKHKAVKTKLITKSGKLIYSTEACNFLEDLTEKELFKKLEGESGFFIAEEDGREKLFTYARSEDYRASEGLQWILMLEYDAEEALKPASILRRNIVIASFILATISAFIAFIISRSISIPIEKLSETMKDTCIEKLNYEIDPKLIKSKNEIGNLASSFELMSEKLRESRRGLEKRAKELEQEVAARVHAEAQLERKMEDLARSNAELEQFAYVASHDLQEPLRKIQAFGGRLESKYDDVIDEKGKDYLHRMLNAAGRMSTLINDLLTYSRVTTRAKSFDLVDLGQVAQEVVSDLEIRIERTGGHVEISELPAIEAEPTQMRQLLQNLIGNALKFHKENEAPAIEVSGKSVNGKCQIMVKDNGIGFDEKYLDRIFTIFQRLHGRFEYEGTGIGLAVCRKIVERHGGSITAESAAGQGATFIVTLPNKQNNRKDVLYV